MISIENLTIKEHIVPHITIPFEDIPNDILSADDLDGSDINTTLKELEAIKELTENDIKIKRNTNRKAGEKAVVPVLGKGGFGSVYLCSDNQFPNKPLAIKNTSVSDAAVRTNAPEQKVRDYLNTELKILIMQTLVSR